MSCSRLIRPLLLLAVLCSMPFMSGAVAAERPWEGEFSVDQQSSTSELVADLGQSTYGVAQWIATGVMAIMILLLIIFAAFQFSQGRTQSALYAIGGIILVALLMGLATSFIF